MAHILGTPYKRGKSDVIQAYNRPDTDIEEGVAIVETSNVTLKKFAGGNDVPVGVMGGTEHKGVSAVLCGAEVFVQVASTVETIALTDKVYVTSTGVFTNVADQNTQINATWVKCDGATIWEDGIVNTGSAKRTNQKCACISFRGGF